MNKICQWNHYVERGLEELILKIPYSYPIYNKIAREYYCRKYRDDVSQYEAPLIIFKRMRIDPNEVKYFTGRKYDLGASRRNNIGTVENGDWDKKQTTPFEKLETYIGLRERFVENRCWEETTLYQWIMDVVNNGRKWHGYSKKNEIKNRLKRIDKIYTQIKEEDYRTQEEIYGDQIDFVNQYINEICVDIGRDGDFLFVDGRHRLSIAKILGLDQIPVFALVRHTSWMEKRDAVYFGQKYNSSHPDMKEL